MRPKALLVLPEAPYPPVGGGALRTASIVESLAKRYELEAVHFGLAGEPDAATAWPAGHLQASHRIELARHSKSLAPRLLRNASRALRCVPPLVDRFSGHGGELRRILGGRRFDLIWVEHFWAAGYARLLRPRAGKLVLDLHNVESAYFDSLAATAQGAEGWLWRHFARCARKWEARLWPEFDVVLTTSEADRARVEHCCVAVAPNTIPWRDLPAETAGESIVFSGNWAYTPNRQGLDWFLAAVWPRLRAARPRLTLRLVGKEPQYIPRGVAGVEVVGVVEDAVREIAKSRVAVAPLLAGSGTRLKIVEAFAAGVAVVSTRLGAEGIGGPVAVADSPVAFAEEVLRLLADEPARRDLAQAGRAKYEAEYTWAAMDRQLVALGL
jgi:glycosyltransferase involved in cell wall biosynthesis